MNWNSTFSKPRKPMNRGTSALRATKRTMRGGRSTGKPTVAEQAWMDFLTAFGCVVCWLQHRAKTPCAVHHIVEGGRRLGHMMTIGLCDPGHHQGAGPDSGKISRHPDKARFECAYGTEYQLLAFLQEQRKQQEQRK